ncbi:MAG: helix-turn-helix transcriptional regulator [Rickettsiales bacterium]
MKTNNIAFLRRRRNLTIPRLSEMTDIPLATLHRIESGGNLKIEKYRKILADALNCAPEDLDRIDLEKITVPIIGESKFKSYVKLLPKEQWRGADLVEGLPETAQAVRIVGTHLVPYHGKNDILYFDGNPEKKDKLFLEKQCFVQIDKGNHLIAWVSKGSRDGHYILAPYGTTQLLIDQKIIKAHPILFVKRG